MNDDNEDSNYGEVQIDLQASVRLQLTMHRPNL